MAVSAGAKLRIYLWAGFVASGLLTVAAEAYLWHLASYFTILWILAAIQCGLGLGLLIKARFAWHTTILVLIGLLIGQKSLILSGITILTWSVGGFAP